MAPTAHVSAMHFESLLVEQVGATLIARFVNPPLNFVNSVFIRDLDTLTRAVDRDPTVRAVVIASGVEGKYMTHADPDELGGAMTTPMPALNMRLMRPFTRLNRRLLRAVPGLVSLLERRGGSVGLALAWGFRWQRAIITMNRSSAVYIAAVSGPATGGGNEISLACDLRFASDSPHVRLGQIEALAGLNPGGGATQRLPSMIGTARALEHMLEGAPITAERAVELGFVNAVVADDALIDHCLAVAGRLTTRSPTTVKVIKNLTYFDSRRTLPAGLDSELAGFVTTGFTTGKTDMFRAFAADLSRLGDSPLVLGEREWIDGTRVEQPR